ncbi:MAG: hypothetical protein QW304_06170 [Thermoproteota archaeon]
MVWRRTLLLLVSGLILFSIILVAAGSDFSMAPFQTGENFTLRVEEGNVVLSDGSMLMINYSPDTLPGVSAKIIYLKILDGEGYMKALERVMVLDGYSSTGRPVYKGALRFGGISPDVEPGINYVGWFEVDGERFEFVYNVTVLSTETIPISGTVPAGWGSPHGSWDMIERVSVYISWQPANQAIGISLVDNTLRKGPFQLVNGGSASVSFTPPYDYRHFHHILIMNFGPSTVSYRGTIWVTHRP